MSSSRRGSRGGRRVQRGRTAGNPPVTERLQREREQFPMLLVEHALTRSACDLALARMVELNPHLRGAHLADVLDMLDQSDSFLGLSEPYWERHGAALADELGAGGHGVATVSLDCAVLLLDMMVQAGPYRTTPDAELTPTLVSYAEKIARAAHAGERERIREPEPSDGQAIEDVAAWLSPDGSLRRRSGRDDALMAGIFGCDSCVHPRADHDPETGACLRINPVYGPCPCEHTNAQTRAEQQERCRPLPSAE